jgi:hypothetical protein
MDDKLGGKDSTMTTYAETLKTSELVNEIRRRGWVKTADIKAGESVTVSDPETGDHFEQDGPAVVLVISEEIMQLY